MIARVQPLRRRIAKRILSPRRATDLERGGKRSATPLWTDPMIQSAVLVPTSRDCAGALQKAVARFAGCLIISTAILGLTPQALRHRALRALYCCKISSL